LDARTWLNIIPKLRPVFQASRDAGLIARLRDVLEDKIDDGEC
jgi:hypothetical protein